MRSEEDNALGLGKDRGATMLKATGWGSCLRLGAGALRAAAAATLSRVRGRPAGVAIKILKQDVPYKTPRTRTGISEHRDDARHVNVR
eukprot:5553745-Pleurochrysis_carterae.AAC.2